MNQVRFCIGQERVSAETRLGVSPFHLPYHLLLFISDSRAYIPSLKRSLSQNGFEPLPFLLPKTILSAKLLTHINNLYYTLNMITLQYFSFINKSISMNFIAAHKGVEPFFLHTLTT